MITDIFTQASDPGGSPYRIATVTSLSSGKPLVKFDGETATSSKLYKRLASYSSPAVNDRVLLLRVFGTYIIIGKIV